MVSETLSAEELKWRDTWLTLYGVASDVDAIENGSPSR